VGRLLFKFYNGDRSFDVLTLLSMVYKLARHKMVEKNDARFLKLLKMNYRSAGYKERFYEEFLVLSSLSRTDNVEEINSILNMYTPPFDLV
jgi:hypothetical protein